MKPIAKTFKTTIHRDQGMCFIPLAFDPKDVFGKVRAYGSVGGGIDGPVSRFKDIFLVSGRIHTIEVITYGGGVMSDLGNRFGVRFDARVFEDIKKTPGADPAHFMFTRVTGNVYVKF